MLPFGSVMTPVILANVVCARTLGRNAKAAMARKTPRFILPPQFRVPKNLTLT
jgi:hypothetical protein